MFGSGVTGSFVFGGCRPSSGGEPRGRHSNDHFPHHIHCAHLSQMGGGG